MTEKAQSKMTAKKKKGQHKDLRPGKGGSSPQVPLVKHTEGAKWYDYASIERLEGEAKNANLEEVESKAAVLFGRDVELYNQLERRQGGSEGAWLSTMVVQGTAGDRTSAMQLIVQRSPIHALSHMTAMVHLVDRKNTREAYAILGVLKELFINELLPPTRKLIPFSMRPLAELKTLSAGSQQNMERRLIMWKFESDLKRLYETFVNAVERLTSGSVETVCAEACRVALDLLIQRPEQEQKLLSLLVNKLGHPNHKLASRLIGYLVKLTQRQPNMRQVIVNEVERLIYRKNVSYRAQLYAVSFLAQLQLRAGETELAASLLNIYIGLFRMLVAKKKMDDKMLAALLTATNRAFPYAKGESDKLVKEIDTLYKVLHQSNFSTALQTLKLLHQLLLTSEGVSDRFYAALYRRLLDVEHSSAKESQLFALLLKTLKSDSVDRRVTAFIKRLLQLSLNRSAAFAAASLVLISKLLEDRPSLLHLSKAADKTMKVESLKMDAINLSDDDEEEHFFDAPEVDVKKGKLVKEEVDQKPDVKPSIATGWVHKNNITLRNESSQYDRSARNPLFAHAEFSVVSELVHLSSHYHPSVAIFASNLMNGVAIRYDGDPMLDFTPMRFLDRFVYRNPKGSKKDEEAKGNVFKRRAYDPMGVKKLAVNSAEYLNKKINEIPADERYLHRFGTLKPKVKNELNEESQEKEQEEEDFDDVGSVNSDEFNMILERFEPGEKNDDFEVNFAKEFGVEKKQKGRKVEKRKKDDEDEEENEGEEDTGEDVEDLEDEDDVESEEGSVEDEEDSEDDYDGIVEGEESDDGMEGFMNQNASDGDSDSDDDMADRLGFADDAAISADRFSELIEEEAEGSSKKSKKKTPKARGFKKRRMR